MAEVTQTQGPSLLKTFLDVMDTISADLAKKDPALYEAAMEIYVIMNEIKDDPKSP
jgi:hypothetical protein